MKITALSDVHGKDVEMFDPHGSDLCLIAGDIAPCYYINDSTKDDQIAWIKEKFCKFISKRPKTQFVLVAGNHDFWGEFCTGHEDWWPTNAFYLKNSSVVLFDGLTVWGSPNVPYIGTARRWAFETSPSGLKEAFSTMPKGTDIVLTHCPPRITGTFIDVPCGEIDFDTLKPLYLGSKELTRQVKKVQPKFLFCGHIHSGDKHEQRIGNTRCYQVSLLDESYHWSYYPLQIDTKDFS